MVKKKERNSENAMERHRCQREKLESNKARERQIWRVTANQLVNDDIIVTSTFVD